MRQRLDHVDLYVGARLRVLRKLAGFTATSFANALGIAPAALDAVERGQTRASAPLLAQAALVLGCSVAKFFGAPERCRQA